MENFIRNISQKFSFVKNPRMKFLGIFLAIIGFVIETLLRGVSHFLANGLVFLIGKDFSVAGSIVNKWFTTSAPIIFVYIPVTIALWLILRDGIKRLDWISIPILIGILIKGGVYGIVSLSFKTSEFWGLTQQGVPGFFLWCFIILFMMSGLVGLIKWFKALL